MADLIDIHSLIVGQPELWQKFLAARIEACWDIMNESTVWDNSTAYTVGDYVRNGGNVYICTTAGTSASSGDGPTGTGTSISDGTAVWDYDQEKDDRLTWAGALLDEYELRGDLEYRRFLSNSTIQTNGNASSDSDIQFVVNSMCTGWAQDYVATLS